MSNKCLASWIVISSLLVAACGSEIKAPTTVDNALIGTTWTLTSIEGDDLLDTEVVTLEFRETELIGQMACNSYGATSLDSAAYSVVGGRVRWGILSQTLVDCQGPDGVMEAEKRYMDTFARVRAYQVSEAELKLFDGDGQLLLVYARNTP